MIGKPNRHSYQKTGPLNKNKGAGSDSA